MRYRSLPLAPLEKGRNNLLPPHPLLGRLGTVRPNNLLCTRPSIRDHQSFRATTVFGG